MDTMYVYIHYLYKKNFLIVTVLPLKKIYMLNESCCQVYSLIAWQFFNMAAIWVWSSLFTNIKNYYLGLLWNKQQFLEISRYLKGRTSTNG